MRDSKKEIINFWFEETSPSQWFQKDDGFDQEIRDRFMVTYNMAKEGLCDDWQRDAEGALAFCLVTDQFPRNMFRDDGKAFETDEMALKVAMSSVSKGFDQIFPVLKRRFFYLPYEHSENIEHQRQCVEFFEKIQDEDPVGYEYAVKHLEVIEKFGRFPHRNGVLGRQNTPEEEEYLAQPGSGF